MDLFACDTPQPCVALVKSSEASGMVSDPQPEGGAKLTPLSTMARSHEPGSEIGFMKRRGEIAF